MSFDREKLKANIAALASQGVYIGTSSWKYEGWLGSLYTPSMYEYRGKLAQSRFKRDCLTEFAQVFKTVSVDAAYYTFPTEKYLQGLSDQTPADFRFSLKVTDAITIKKFPNLDRFGPQAGRTNEHFLDAQLFINSFLSPCKAIRSKIGLIMFEFSQFWPTDYVRGRDFMNALDQFFTQLPKDWPYAVEIRNRTFLHPEYFTMLRRHCVTHIFNSWTEMPPTIEQIDLPGCFTTDELFGARMLLRPGRRFEEAVKLFSPYNGVKEIYPEGRAAGLALVRKARRMGARGKGFIYVNNRFEGNALQTIAAILDAAEREGLITPA